MRFLLSGLLVAGLVGCSWLPSKDKILPDKKVEYKRESQSERNLEIPPDLTQSTGDGLTVPGVGGATYSQFVNTQQRLSNAGPVRGDVLPKQTNVEMKRDGDQRWLVIDAEPQEVWPLLIAFWQQNGILLNEQDPAVGVMRTAWLENRADIRSDFITDTLRRFVDGLYSSGTRDQYRVRLERGQRPGTTELYLTHRGMEEQIVTRPSGDTEQAVWVPRGTDHGLEAIMLQRIMAYLGASNDEERAVALAKAKQAPGLRSQLTQTKSGSMVTIKEEFNRAWRLTGVALDRVGFAVEDRDRARGIYLVRYDDPYSDQEKSGLLSKLAFWRDERKIDKESQYQVSLRPEGDTTVVVVLDKDGQRSNSDTAKRILALINEQLR